MDLFIYYHTALKNETEYWNGLKMEFTQQWNVLNHYYDEAMLNGNKDEKEFENIWCALFCDIYTCRWNNFPPKNNLVFFCFRGSSAGNSWIHQDGWRLNPMSDILWRSFSGKMQIGLQMKTNYILLLYFSITALMYSTNHNKWLCKNLFRWQARWVSSQCSGSKWYTTEKEVITHPKVVPLNGRRIPLNCRSGNVSFQSPGFTDLFGMYLGPEKIAGLNYLFNLMKAAHILRATYRWLSKWWYEWQTSYFLVPWIRWQILYIKKL